MVQSVCRFLWLCVWNCSQQITTTKNPLKIRIFTCYMPFSIYTHKMYLLKQMLTQRTNKSKNAKWMKEKSSIQNKIKNAWKKCKIPNRKKNSIGNYIYNVGYNNKHNNNDSTKIKGRGKVKTACILNKIHTVRNYVAVKFKLRAIHEMRTSISMNEMLRKTCYNKYDELFGASLSFIP